METTIWATRRRLILHFGQRDLRPRVQEKPASGSFMSSGETEYNAAVAYAISLLLGLNLDLLRPLTFWDSLKYPPKAPKA